MRDEDDFWALTSDEWDDYCVSEAPGAGSAINPRAIYELGFTEVCDDCGIPTKISVSNFLRHFSVSQDIDI